MQSRTLMMPGPPTSVFLHHLISRSRRLPHDCGLQPHGTVQGVAHTYDLGMRSRVISGKVWQCQHRRRQGCNDGEGPIYFEGHDDDFEPLYGVNEELRALCTYYGKQGGPDHPDLGEPNHTNNKQPAGEPKNSNQLSFSNSLIGAPLGNSIYTEPEGSISMQSPTREHELV